MAVENRDSHRPGNCAEDCGCPLDKTPRDYARNAVQYTGAFASLAVLEDVEDEFVLAMRAALDLAAKHLEGHAAGHEETAKPLLTSEHEAVRGSGMIHNFIAHELKEKAAQIRVLLGRAA